MTWQTGSAGPPRRYALAISWSSNSTRRDPLVDSPRPATRTPSNGLRWSTGTPILMPSKMQLQRALSSSRLQGMVQWISIRQFTTENSIAPFAIPAPLWSAPDHRAVESPCALPISAAASTCRAGERTSPLLATAILRLTESTTISFIFVYRVEGVVKSRDFHKTVDKSREFGYLKLDEWERVQRICRN